MTHATAIKLLSNKLGNRWTKGNHDRVYLTPEALTSALNLTIDRYGTGSVSSATLDGEKISNNYARQIFESLSHARAYCDARTGEFHWVEFGREAGKVAEAIENIIESL